MCVHVCLCAYTGARVPARTHTHTHAWTMLNLASLVLRWEEMAQPASLCVFLSACDCHWPSECKLLTDIKEQFTYCS